MLVSLLSVLGVLGAAGFTTLGLVLNSRNEKKIQEARIVVERRKVDTSAFHEFEDSTQRKIVELEKRLDKMDLWLKLAMGHIEDIRLDAEMGRELTPFPRALNEVPFWFGRRPNNSTGEEHE